MARDGDLSFFGKLRLSFGDRFLCYLLLTYFGLKGVACTLVDSSLLPFFRQMGVSGTEFQLATVVARIPWSMKGFVGVLSDCFPLGRYHKRGYLLASAAVGAVGLAILGTVHIDTVGPASVWQVAALFCSAYFLISTFDLLCEGKYSELMRKEGGGSEVLTLVWTCLQLGALAASFVVGLLVDREGPQPLLLACLPIGLVAAWRTACGDLPEEPARSWKSLLLKAWSEPGLFVLATFMACGGLVVAVATTLLSRQGRALVSIAISIGLVLASYRALPKAIALSNLYMFIISVAYLDLTGPLAYFYTGGPACVEDGPNFSYSYFLAVSNIVGSLGAALGAVMFQYMQHWRFREAFCVTTLIQVVASAFDLLIVGRLNVALGLPDKAAYLFGDAACQSMALQMALMPMALLTARLCPRGAEATVFAILAGFQNFGGAVSSILGVLLTESFGVEARAAGPCNFEWFKTLIVIGHGVIPLACLPLTWVLVPSARMDDEQAFGGTPPPSFASPAPSSPASSPRNSPVAALTPRGSSDAGDVADVDQEHYQLLREEDDDPEGFRLSLHN